jgi:site-specific recombinase XerD
VKNNPDHTARYTLLNCPETRQGFSPYRLFDSSGHEVQEVNDFLDAQAARGLSMRSLRAYGYSLLNFSRWKAEVGCELSGLKEADLLDYIRFQEANPPRDRATVSPKTINHRLTVVRCLYRYHSGSELPIGTPFLRTRSHPYYSSTASAKGYLHPAQPRFPQIHKKVPRQVVVPLTREEVRLFVESLRTWRDLSIAALMLFCGLRSHEVIALSLEDVSTDEDQLRVRGKGDKERMIPLSPQVISALESYLEIERPRTSCRKLFVSLKGRKRGQPMTLAGLRSVFRHHRRAAGVPKANPHRFRHTFGADMVRAGISLPALMKLMGHGDINTTMLYVEISPQDVWEEFQRVLRNAPTQRFPLKED